MQVARGYRNNNPLNIRRSSDKWFGMCAVQRDKSFVQFVSMAYGCRAAYVLFYRYFYKYTCRTIESVISRWAPPLENDTFAYIRTVVSYMCENGITVTKDTGIDFENIDFMVLFLKAMSKVENGYVIPSLDAAARLGLRMLYLRYSRFTYLADILYEENNH